jgi:hypothetical protein
MFHRTVLVGVIVAVAGVTSCGGDVRSGEPTAATAGVETLPAVTPDEPQPAGAEPVAEPKVDAVTTVVTGQAAAVAESPTQSAQLDQPAIWPASDVLFETPEEAAAGFVADVLGVEPVLGDFAAGDARSGEIQVFSPGDGAGAELTERALLALRMIGPTDGWFVIAANSEGVMIESPETLDRVPAGPLVVTGRGRGFESTLVVSAFRAGEAGDVVDQVIAAGGAFGDLEPFTATLDLSDAAPGDVVAVLVRGDTGLDGDPGEFASLPIVIDDPLPETR